MASSRSREIRLWWPLPLAALVWLLLIWGLGFFLSIPEVEIETPPPIAASFIDLNETEDAKSSLPASPQSAPTPPQEKPKAVEEVKPAPKLPPLPAPSPPSRSQPKPKAAEKPSKPTPNQPAKDKAITKALPKAAPDAPTDLSDYINQAKARRRAEGFLDNDDMAANTATPQPTADEIRMANVRRNLQTPGTSGIFQILRIGPRTAEFSFRAWTTGQSNPRLQTIQVDAGPDGNVELAMIRRMIQLIREHYKEDFNWESHRLHRVVVLSAREKDSAGLEDFLMREFFINPVR
ncbi:MAG: cell envelope integrity protein TolA [Nitrosomonas sp.]|nr:cell envelope integrity protein TolA [Nitrosomonas sp.]